MGGERWHGAEDRGRESAPFDVTAEDYRRAFALAIASWPQAMPPFGARVTARLAPLVSQGIWLLAAMVAALIAGRMFQDPGSAVEALGEALSFAFKAGGVMLAIVLIIAVHGAWDERGARRRFPKQQAEWKRAQRMRLRWNATGLVIAGQEGFGSFAWRTLHAWIETADTLVIFTATYDPVPVPHAALSAEDLDDLRVCLTGAEVPREWLPLSADQQGLKRVFG